MNQPNPMPTPEEQEKAFTAWRNGAENVEFWGFAAWHSIHRGHSLGADTILRIRPEPVKKWRAYTAEEVKGLARVKDKATGRRGRDENFLSGLDGLDGCSNRLYYLVVCLFTKIAKATPQTGRA